MNNIEVVSTLFIVSILIYLLIKDNKNNKRIKSLSNNIESISELFGTDESLNLEENDLLTFKMRKIIISINNILRTMDKMKNRITELDERVSLLEELNEHLEYDNITLQKRISMYKKLYF